MYKIPQEKIYSERKEEEKRIVVNHSASFLGIFMLYYNPAERDEEQVGSIGSWSGWELGMRLLHGF